MTMRAHLAGLQLHAAGAVSAHHLERQGGGLLLLLLLLRQDRPRGCCDAIGLGRQALGGREGLGRLKGERVGRLSRWHHRRAFALDRNFTVGIACTMRYVWTSMVRYRLLAARWGAVQPLLTARSGHILIAKTVRTLTRCAEMRRLLSCAHRTAAMSAAASYAASDRKEEKHVQLFGRSRWAS